MIEIRVPASKSVTHRAFLLAAQSSTPCVVAHPLLGADCRSTLDVLRGLGAQFEIVGDAVHFTPTAGLAPPSQPLDCGNSGTTLRLMAGQAATLGAPATFTGDASLESRPNGPLLDALTDLGARVESADGRAPFTVCGPLAAGDVYLPAKTSSQYASSLILAAAIHLRGANQIWLARPVASRPYLDITLEVAQAFGLRVNTAELDTHLVFSAPGPQRPAARRFEVEGDWSGAAFPLVAGAILGQAVRLTGLRRGSTQGDEAVAELVARFGPAVAWAGDALTLHPAPLVGAGEVDLGACPDLFPALVALAARAVGETVFVNAPSLRHKECDRIAAMTTGLDQLGVTCEARPDGLRVVGGAPRGPAHIAAHHDHRIHMAFSILAAETRGVSVADRGCEAVSYPNFHADLARLRGA